MLISEKYNSGKEAVQSQEVCTEHMHAGGKNKETVLLTKKRKAEATEYV